MSMNILILAAGNPEFDTKDGNYPLCLTELNNTSLIEKMVKACDGLEVNNFIFALRKEDVDRYHLDNMLSLMKPGSKIIKVHGSTPGAACTALLAAGYIDNEDELLILSANEIIDTDYKSVIENFRSRCLDAGTITFSSMHPRYSYVRLGADNLVVEAAEKNPISKNATASLYWYSSGSDFIESVKRMIRKDAKVEGLYYLCPAFNEMVLAQKKIGVYQIESKKYHPLKTERQLQNYEAQWEAMEETQ